jgi:hypothetical protein
MKLRRNPAGMAWLAVWAAAFRSGLLDSARDGRLARAASDRNA